MASDFIERVVTMLESNVAARSSELLGEEDAATAKALRLIGPAIFAGLVMEGTSTEGASKLLDLIRSTPFSTGLGDDLLGVIRRRQSRTGAQQRDSLSARLFKDHLDPLAQAISDASGVTTASAEHLLEISIVVSCSVLRARALDDGSSPVHLARILGRQRGDVGERLDAHLAQAIDYELPSSRQADIEEATQPVPIVEHRPRPESVRAATNTPATSPRPGQERRTSRRPTIEGMLRTDRRPPRAGTTFEGVYDPSGSEGAEAGASKQTPPPDLPAMPSGDDVPLTFELAAIDEANAVGANAADAADPGKESGREESRQRAARKSPPQRDDKFGWEAVSSDDVRPSTPPAPSTPPIPRAKTAPKPSVIELFQQRLSTPGLPIATQFLSAARRDEIAKGARSLLAGVKASEARATKSAPPIKQTPVARDTTALSEPLVPLKESPQASPEDFPVASDSAHKSSVATDSEHKNKRRRKGAKAVDSGGADGHSAPSPATPIQSIASPPTIGIEAIVESKIPAEPAVEATPVAALPADAGDPPPAEGAPVNVAPEPPVIATPDLIVPAASDTAQSDHDEALDAPAEWAQMYVPRPPDPVTVYIQFPAVKPAPSVERSSSGDEAAAVAEIAPNAASDLAIPDADATVHDLPPASAPVPVEAIHDGRAEPADRTAEQARDAIHDQFIENSALGTEATSSQEPFEDESPSPASTNGATPEWPFSIAALEIRLAAPAPPDRASATSEWPFAPLSAHAFSATGAQHNDSPPTVEVEQPPEPKREPDWGWGERRPGAIPTDSLVFPELTRSVELHADASRSVDENPAQSPHMLSDESTIRMSGGGVLSTVVPFHAPKPPGGKSISRWWLAPTLVVAVVVSLFIFDYRAALEKRGGVAPIVTPSGTPTADAERPATAAPTIGPRKTIELPGGRQLEARANGAIANLVTYLSELGAAPGRAFVLDEVVFERDTSILTPLSEEQMRQIAQVMQAFPRTKARIESHMEADATGSRLVTAERAATVKAALILLGVEDARLESRGMAGERPIATGDSPEDKAKNRRIELILTAR